MSLFLAQFFMTRLKLCESQRKFLELIFEQKTTPSWPLPSKLHYWGLTNHQTGYKGLGKYIWCLWTGGLQKISQLVIFSYLEKSFDQKKELIVLD